MIMTLATKIMFGAIPGLTKAKYHALNPRKSSFANMLLDVLSVATPDLFIMDGIIGMQGDGPSAGEPVHLGVLLASTDPVAMDLAVCHMLRLEPIGIPTLKQAKLRHLWPHEIIYPLLSPDDVAYTGFVLPNTAGYLLTGKDTPKKSPVVTPRCTACGQCHEICPKGAITNTRHKATIDYDKCIRCYACHEVCPEKAIVLEYRAHQEHP
jgi:ferredoxin